MNRLGFRSRRRFWTLCVGFLMLGMLAVPFASTWAGESQLLLDKGLKVYAESKCAICHIIQGKGGKLSSDLSRIGAERDAHWLRLIVKDPKAVNPEFRMPPFQGSDADLDALVAYLQSLR